MRLLKIGRDTSCDIVLHSEKVSSLHAEITLLNSGDILLEDKGSRNGTFVMNQSVQPNKPVNIRRGDAIRFADVELQWSQVPMPEDNSTYKGIYGIGTNFNNEIQLSGSTVSRYHATVKQGKDGKMYIVDHSKNGTTVDGSKITPNNPYRIKKKSAVVCGGVPVDLSRLPWPNELWKKIAGVAAVVVVLVGVGLGVYKLIDSGGKTSLQALEKATACVIGNYYIEVTFKDDPFVNKINGWPDKWVFGVKDERLTLGTLTGIDVNPIGYRGTAFFISPYGDLGTNRHIARPWKFISEEQKDYIKQYIAGFLSDEMNAFLSKKGTVNAKGLLYQKINEAIYNNQLSYSEAVVRLERFQKSDLEISGHINYIGLVLSGTNFSTIADLASCQVIIDSENDDRDVALLRLNSKKTPEDIVKGGFFDIEKARTDEKSLVPQEEELTTIGFPAEFGTGENIISKGAEFLPTVHRTYVSKTPDDNQFQLQSNVVGGQSGSPIVDKKHHLVGVVWGSIRGTDVAYGCNIKHLKELYDKHKTRN